MQLRRDGALGTSHRAADLDRTHAFPVVELEQHLRLEGQRLQASQQKPLLFAMSHDAARRRPGIAHGHVGEVVDDARCTLAQVLEQDVSRDSECIRPKAVRFADRRSTFGAQQQRALGEVLRLRRHAQVEEPQQSVAVPSEQAIARVRVTRAPALQQLCVSLCHIGIVARSWSPANFSRDHLASGATPPRSKMGRRCAPLFALAFVGLGACYGGLRHSEPGADDPDDPDATDGSLDGDEGVGSDGGEDEGSDGEPSDPPDADCIDEPLPASGQRHLTRMQYEHAVIDVLGLDPRTATEGFIADATIGSYAANAGGEISTALAGQYQLAAERIAAGVDAVALTGCDEDTLAGPDSGCVEGFVRDVGTRLFRRPATDGEVAAYVSLFVDERTARGSHAGVELVVAALLQSPNFLHILEQGSPDPDDATLRRLSDYELATRLALLIWASVPDDELLAAAEAGELQAAPEREAQARRLLADPRAHRGLDAFFAQWLGIDDLHSLPIDPAAYPEVDAELRDAMQAETLESAHAVILEGDGRLATLLSLDRSMMSPELASFYGLPAPDSEGWVQLPEERRAGILTHASVLAAYGREGYAPVFRGKFVRERLLCQAVPPPPPDIDTDLPPAEGSNPREHWNHHIEEPACAGCHSMLDPLGYPLEHFDRVGRWRESVDGWEIDGSSEVTGTDVDGPVAGPGELARRLANSEVVARCAAAGLSQLALARPAAPLGTCEAQELNAALFDADTDLRELLVQLAVSDAFAHRRIPE